MSNEAEILKAYLKREASSKSTVADTILDSLFPKQRKFIEDTAKEKVAVCGRRAGKSTGGIAGILIDALKNPGASYLYAGLTRKSAKRVGWKTLKAQNRRFNLQAAFHETDLIATLPNGAELCFIGLDDADAAEALRGEKFRIILLDEAASYGTNLKYVVEEVLTPMLMDANGALWWMGTPSAACAGPFFAADHNPEISSHYWTVLDNPFIPNAAQWLESYRKKMGWSIDNAIYLREYMGKWINDSTSLVYHYDADKCRGEMFKDHTWNYILGVDLGYDDATAIVVVAYSDSSPNLYVVDEFKRSRMLPTDVAYKLKEYQSLYSPVATVVDTGGLGKAIAEEMKARHGIALRPAEKKNKREYIELINSDLFEGRIKFTSSVPHTKAEISILQWDEAKRHEDSRFDNHLCDALLYAWRESGHWGFQRTKPETKPFTDAWAAQHERDLAEKMQENEKKNWWEKLFYRLFPDNDFPVFNFNMRQLIETAARRTVPF